MLSKALEILKAWTVYPVEDNAKLSAFIALCLGWLEGKFNIGVSLFKLVVGIVT